MPSLAVCLPVWNRGELFELCFRSLLGQLDGIEASIWIFDNGSRPRTRRIIEGLEAHPHKLFKISLPENMGIPYAVNCFSQLVAEPCDYTDHRAPQYVMLADSDAYFKSPVRDMLDILASNNHYAILSGHDSVEHEALNAFELALGEKQILIKEKKIERGLCLLMRAEELRIYHPFPHHRNRDVDWELAKWHRYSISARMRKLVAVDYVVHLGLYESTWSPCGVPASEEQINEINEILKRFDCFTPERQAKMGEYLQRRHTRG